MSSFLVTPKMSPELAARVEASVRGKHRHGARRLFVPRFSMAALLPVAAVLVVVGLTMVNRWVTHRALERDRSDLLERLANERASLPAGAATFLPSAQAWVARMAGAYEGDWVSLELRKTGALQAQWSRPALYLRADQSKLAKTDQLMEAASASVKDAVLLCISDPPDSRAAKAVLQKIRGANFAAVLPSVRRFHDAEAGLALLQPWWETKVRAADDLKALQSLRRELMRAPLEDGRHAANAELLVIVVDEAPDVEPNAEQGDPRRMEEHPHTIRVGMVDLRAQSMLLRLRRNIDPSTYAPSMLAAHARAITGCLVAMEVRDAVGN
jgi:hypothetical protein